MNCNISAYSDHAIHESAKQIYIVASKADGETRAVLSIIADSLIMLELARNDAAKDPTT